MTYIRFVTVGLCLMFMACSPRALHEAQRVVTEADSLRETGQIYDDSAVLAQSYTTLGRWQWIHADQYAHACYHYGRILRRSDDPVAAMQVFIDATHSHTTDNHILGRVYSNMGSICHLAGEFSLSYDLYEQSGECFKTDGDSVAYYYALNDMAIELAEQKDSIRTMNLLDSIAAFQRPELYIPVMETRALLYQALQQYDSVITIISKLQTIGYKNVYGCIMKTRALSYLEQKDSALQYAQWLLPQTKERGNLVDLYYILCKDKTGLSADSISVLSSKRIDILKDWTISKNKYAQAIQLLEQDLNHKPDLRWLYVLIATLAIIGSGCYIYVYRKRKKQQLLTQQIDILEQATSVIQEKHQELTERYLTDHKRIENEINSRCSIFQTNESIKKKLAWRNYKKMCNITDKQFYLLASKLRDKHSLKENEVRICILTLLNCSSEQMAELLYKSPTSIGTLKGRVANKLGTTSGKMRMYLIDNVCVK